MTPKGWAAQDPEIFGDDPAYGGSGEQSDLSALDKEAAWAGIIDMRLARLADDAGRMDQLITFAQLTRPLRGNRFLKVNELVIKLRAVADELERHIRE